MADRGISDLLSSASSLLNSQSQSSNPSPGHSSKSSDRGFSDLLSSASSLLNSQSQSSNPNASKPSSAYEGSGIGKPQSSHAQKPSYDEVYASAQVVMDAAKNKLHNSGSSAEDADYGKLANAASTLIGAASHYGNLEEGGYGKYAQKAQEYLQSYGMKHGKPGTIVPPSQPSTSPEYGQGHQVPPSQPSISPGYGQGHQVSSHAPSEVHLNQPSAPSQGYPTAYPPQGYPGAQQGYDYVPQGHSKPVDVDDYPPAGYPPAGYPTSAGSYTRPSKYY